MILIYINIFIIVVFILIFLFCRNSKHLFYYLHGSLVTRVKSVLSTYYTTIHCTSIRLITRSRLITMTGIKFIYSRACELAEQLKLVNI